ncbi:MAG TPA: rubrerythrin family protein [Planctomycetota bacterium]|nr:rubrerythrin family protein [Planctomycetota bacterium]
MHAMTAANLRSAFGGESMAHMRYKVWGAKAAADGFPNVARLFTAISHAEQVHATNHFKAMADEAGAHLVASGAGFGLGSTSQNLAGAIEGETFEVEEMYPAYIAVARDQGEKGAVQSFHYAVTAEKFHAALYAEAKKAVDAGRDMKIGPVVICGVCGYTAEGAVPAKCPICGAAKDQFTTFA